MAIDLDGARPRYFHERARNEAQVGFPLRAEVSVEARQRVVREVKELAWGMGQNGAPPFPFSESILAETRRVLGDVPAYWSQLDAYVVALPTERFLTFLEISAAQLYFRRRSLSDIKVLQSILKDDLASFRFVDVGSKNALLDKFQIQQIDNEHLHRDVTDRTFELTRIADFEVAQRDYAEAWKHYAQDDFDDALVNAHKAFESAAKTIIKRVDDTKTPEQMQTNQLVPLLVELDILPRRLSTMVANLQQIFMGAGALRNAAGTGHGSLHLTNPEASVALMGLRMSGTLISFLAERWMQLKPSS